MVHAIDSKKQAGIQRRDQARSASPAPANQAAGTPNQSGGIRDRHQLFRNQRGQGKRNERLHILQPSWKSCCGMRQAFSTYRSRLVSSVTPSPVQTPKGYHRRAA